MHRVDPKDLLELLGRLGPSRAPVLCEALGISQSTFSRLVGRCDERLVVAGARKGRRYGAGRAVDGKWSFPVYRVHPSGNAERVAVLHAVQPRGFLVEGLEAGFSTRGYDDLPYFLYDQRPAGYLGRLIPQRHPDLRVPSRVTDWSGDHCLLYFATHGWDLPGDLIIGEDAYTLYMRQRADTVGHLQPSEREQTYPLIAQDVVRQGVAGSSAGGEQPKFLVTHAPGGRGVLVKFSPRGSDPVAVRWKDLLVSECLALQTLTRYGQDAANAYLLEAEGRYFLEVTRFDRVSGGGRRGAISMMALDLEHVGGDLRDWSASADTLARRRVITREMARDVRWRQNFGALIANSDMHAGNQAFFAEGENVTGVAPVYDMLPMLYAPTQGELTHPAFEPPTPEPDDAGVWESSRNAAQSFWEAVVLDPRVSGSFRGIAHANAERVRILKKFEGLLPRT